MSKWRAMDIHEFTALVGETPRQIRFLIAEKFMPSPTGGRAHAQYGPEHVEAVHRYRQLRSRYSPAQIKLMMSAYSPKLLLPVAPGVELLLDRSLLGPRISAEKIADRVRQVLSELPSPESSPTTSASSPNQKDPIDVG
jgi:DNA-binding transcriptional MerR regulator